MIVIIPQNYRPEIEEKAENTRKCPKAILRCGVMRETLEERIQIMKECIA